MPTEPAGTLPAAIEERLMESAEALCPPNFSGRDIARDELPRIEAVLRSVAEAAYAAGQAEPCYCCREDGDQFGCRDGCACHAAVKAASSPRPSGEGEGGRP